MIGQVSGLSETHLRLFMAILVQNEIVFSHFRSRLTVAHFVDDEKYQLLYRVLLDYHAAYDSLPGFAQIETELSAHLEEDPYVISEESREELSEFLAFAFDPELFADRPVDSEKSEKYAFEAGRRFLMQHERRQLAQSFSETLELNQLPFVLRAAQSRLDLIQMTRHTRGANLLFKEHWDKSIARMIQSTGLGFLDKYLGGGTSAGEVYGVMAPYGTCKTTLAVMLWCAAAQQCYEETFSDEWDKRKGLSILVTYEASASPELQRRCLMYAAQVSRNSLDRMSGVGLSMLSDDPDHPLPYEKKIMASAISGGVFQPERQRVEKAVEWLNPHAFCLDFSGADEEFPTAGSGGIDEIIQRIRLELRNRGKDYYVKNVIIDYLGLMVDRDTTLGMDRTRKEDHRTYQQANEKIAKQICKYFKCHAWVFHQLSGTANAMLSPTKTLHHTDAKGSKSFAENLDFAFVFGNLNADSRGQVACTKHRNFRQLPPTVIEVDGEFNLVRAPDSFHIDSDGKIVDKATLASVGAATAETYGDLPQQGTTAGSSQDSEANDDFAEDDDVDMGLQGAEDDVSDTDE